MKTSTRAPGSSISFSRIHHSTSTQSTFGLPRTDNANYLWIQIFYSALNGKGRAGFIMANSASDARSSEQELRRQLSEDRGVDVMVAVGPNMFYTVNASMHVVVPG